MTTRFADRVVLVTGGGSGIGRATALAFAEAGATVVVAGRTEERLAETVKLIEVAGGKASAVRADVTNAEDAATMVRTAVDRHGGLHVAFNNAGVFAAGKVAEMTEQSWSALLAGNLTSVWLSMRSEIEHMRANGGGVIINNASVLGAHLRAPGVGGYAASKAGVSALTRTAALEYIGDGIRINAISPGAHATSMSLHPGETDADRAERLRTEVPIGRVGSLDEIADSVCWLASSAAGFVVGQDIVLDGGAAA